MQVTRRMVASEPIRSASSARIAKVQAMTPKLAKGDRLASAPGSIAHQEQNFHRRKAMDNSRRARWRRMR
jgi:hypothetical protein